MTYRLRLILPALAALLLATASARSQVIVDNDDGAPAYTETGPWTTSGSTGYDGGTYRFANVGDTATATWTASLPEAGDYEVFVWYVPGGNRATSAKYDIVAADGPHTVYISQVTGGYTWDSLGTFTFNAGDNTITVDVAGSTGGDVVIADAVRFGGGGEDPCTPGTPDEVAPGVFHTVYTCPGPLVAHVLEFDLDDPQYTLEMGFAQGRRNYGTQRETVPQISARYDSGNHDVVGAVNCGFFSYDSIWLVGMLGNGGNYIGPPTPGSNSETYMLQESGEGWAARYIPIPTITARFADEAEMDIGVFDDFCGTSTLALYTTDWGAGTASTTQGVEVIVEDVNYPFRINKEVVGRITAVHTGAASLDNTIPAGGFVIHACPGDETELQAHASVGELVTVTVDLDPPELNNAKVISGAVGWVVKDGVEYDPGQYGDFGSARHPRTVLAWDETRHWFVTFDGRQPGYSIGANFPEMADFLINSLAVDNAVNFDGGGSTTMVIDNAVANCPSSGADPPCTGTPRAVGNAMLLVNYDPTSNFPLQDDFPSTGRELPWDDKFSFNPVAAFAPPAPGGDGYVMEVRNPAGGYETTSLGAPGDTGYTVSAKVHCEYRPDVATDGFERVGLFVRDDGNANFEATDQGGGNCYALTYDSHDGRIRAGVVVDGVFTDFLAGDPVHELSTGWRSLAMECYGSAIEYFVDGVSLIAVTDSTHAHGRFGIAHHEYFATDTNVHGARVDNFSVMALDFDWDNDGDIDLTDFAVFAYCLQGPGDTFATGHMCLEMDGDGDYDVDLADFALMQTIFTGSGG